MVLLGTTEPNVANRNDECKRVIAGARLNPAPEGMGWVPWVQPLRCSSFVGRYCTNSFIFHYIHRTRPTTTQLP